MPKPKYPFLPAVEKKYYPAIGFVIVQWAFLETEIDSHTLGLLRKAHAQETRLPRPFKKRLELYRKLTRAQYSGEALAAILDIIDRCAKCRGERDRIAHGRWSVGQDRSFVARWRNGAYRDEKPLTSEDIYATAAAISTLTYDLFVFHRKYDLPSWWSSFQERSPHSP